MKNLIRLLAVLMLLVCNAVLADVTFVHTDVLGSPVAETNSDGQLVRLSHYKPFGEELEQKKDDIAYPGHKYDAALGLIYMQARYYDPVIGRFYSNDPVGTLEHLKTPNGIHGFNRYAYANNNPYKYIDPDGKQSYQSLGVYIGARLDGKSHEEATQMMKSSIDSMGKGTKELMSFTKGGVIIDVVETTNEVLNGENIKDNFAAMTTGEIAGGLTEKLVEKKFGKEGAEVIGAVVGKFSSDAAKDAT